MSLLQFGLITALSGLLVTTSGCKKAQDSTPPDDVEADDDDDDDDDDGDDGDGDDGDGDGDDGDDDDDEDTMLTTISFEETVHAHMEEVSDCYSEAVGANAELKGTLEGVFTISADGELVEFKAADGSSLNDEGLNTCIGDKAKSWKFGKPAGREDMTLTFPFNLSPA